MTSFFGRGLLSVRSTFIFRFREPSEVAILHLSVRRFPFWRTLRVKNGLTFMKSWTVNVKANADSLTPLPHSNFLCLIPVSSCESVNVSPTWVFNFLPEATLPHFTYRKPLFNYFVIYFVCFFFYRECFDSSFHSTNSVTFRDFDRLVFSNDLWIMNYGRNAD